MGEDIATPLATPLAAVGLVAVDATISTAGSRRVLRVLVDRDVRGLDPADTSSRVAPLTLDEVADATSVVGRTLDDDGLMGERSYTLEVSSPGVGRRLAGYAAFRRNVGRLIAVSLASGETLTARVLAVGPDEVTVDVPAGRKARAERRTLPMEQVRAGAVQVEFGRVADEDVDEDVDEDGEREDLDEVEDRAGTRAKEGADTADTEEED